jgi:hypothetical protein
MSKIEQVKINLNVEDLFRYKLVRERDGLSNVGHKAGWIEWNEDGTFKKLHDEAAVGRSLILDPQRISYTWMTTTVTEILEQKENYIKFATTNSIYELWQNE